MHERLSTTVVVPDPNRFSDKETACILGLSNASKAHQAMHFSWRKVAQHARLDWMRTMRRLMHEIDELNRLEPMSDEEIALREAMLCGRVDRQRIHPHASTTRQT